jgi:hypothetical protein
MTVEIAKVFSTFASSKFALSQDFSLLQRIFSRKAKSGLVFDYAAGRFYG